MSEQKEKGVWRTVFGRHIFIKDGQSLSDAMKESGKYDDDCVEKIKQTEKGKSGDKSDSQKELEEFMGEEFKGVKGQAAIDKLVQEKRGHVKGAFYRDDIGDIDLVWGNESAGLQHIQSQRLKENNGEKHSQEIFENLADSITNGSYDKKNDRGNFEFIRPKGNLTYRVIIAPEYRNNKITYVLTAYRKGKQNK